jgi:octopine/nopaline transport system permease protein
MEVFIAAGAIYLVLNFLIVWALSLFETRLTHYRVRA